MNPDTVSAEFIRASRRVVRMWVTGWIVMSKFLAAIVIIALFVLPLWWIAAGLAELVAAGQTTPVYVAVAVFIVFYLPLVLYVAGSAVGFCRYIKAPNGGPSTNLSL